MVPKLIVAVDVAGVDALAGPLVASAIVLPATLVEPSFMFTDSNGKRRQGNLLRRASNVTEPLRSAVVLYLRQLALSWAVVQFDVKRIRFVSELQAETDAPGMAIVRALERLLLQQPDALERTDRSQIRVYTSLRRCIPRHYLGSVELKKGVSNWWVGAAHLMAATARATVMHQLSLDYPLYQFDQHQGYATKEHRRILRKLGPSPEHRDANA